MLANTSTPDGYQVNASGAWVQNGAVQTKNLRANSQTTSSRPKLVLFDVEPTYNLFAHKEKNITVTDGETWTDTLNIYPGGIFEFSNEKGYTRLRAKVAPQYTQYSSEQNSCILIVYEDNGSVLYRSDEMVEGETEPFDIDIDISGQSKIQFTCSSKAGANLVIKSARFE